MNDQVAIITASNRGIGQSCAKRLAREGTAVYLAVRNEAAGEAIAREIRDGGGRAGVVFFNADQPETLSTSIAAVLEREGRVDALINNFGFTDVKTDFDVVNGDAADFFRIVETNLMSVYLPVKAVLPAMQAQRSGAIVNISSVGGRYADVSRTAYGTAKAAINFLTKAVAVQYGAYGVRCNAILPGYIETDASKGSMSPEFLSSFLSTVPLGRAGTPKDIAALAAFLCGPEAGFITGELIEAAGGFGKPSPMYPLYKNMKAPQ